MFNNTGYWNTANGAHSLYNNTKGFFNTASGVNALFSNTTGSSNTANGDNALFSNTGGVQNTANGVSALAGNKTGNNNTANGFNALYNNTTGNWNTANGGNALYNNTTGNDNTASGVNALYYNTTGGGNTANGVNALASNGTGKFNTAYGLSALASNTIGNSNIALGTLAGENLTTGSNNIDIGNYGVASESNKIRIGTKGTHNGTFIAGISGVAVTGSQVVVNSNGKLGVAASSARFKDNVKPMDKASEAILALKPVTFRYKSEIDSDGIPQFGLVAEQVEKVNPDLVARDDEGKAYTVRYEAVNAMLLNEFLKQHRKVEEMETKAEQQQKQFESAFAKQEATIERQQKQIESLAAGLRKVSNKLESSKPGPHRLADNQ